MLNITVCDDDPVSCRTMAGMLGTLDGELENRTTCYTSVGQMKEAMRLTGTPDIAVMDIRLQKDNGIDVVKEVFQGTETQIIYATSFIECCQEVYETDHVWLLKKPVSREYLIKALQEAVKRIKSTEEKFYLKSGSKVLSLPARDILYFESEGRKIRIRTDQEEYEVYSTIEKMCEQAGPEFVHCHKSFLINMNRVKSMERNGFAMDNGRLIPISRSMGENARDSFFHFLSERSQDGTS